MNLFNFFAIDRREIASTTETSGYNTWNGLDACNPDEFQTLRFPLRWDDTLNHRSVSLKKLSTFEMGRGRWNHSGRDSFQDQNSTSIEESVYSDEHTHEHLSWYNACRNFAALAPKSLDFTSPHTNSDRAGIRYAPEYEETDMCRRVMPQLGYLKFDMHRFHDWSWVDETATGIKLNTKGHNAYYPQRPSEKGSKRSGETTRTRCY